MRVLERTGTLSLSAWANLPEADKREWEAWDLRRRRQAEDVFERFAGHADLIPAILALAELDMRVEAPDDEDEEN